MAGAGMVTAAAHPMRDTLHFIGQFATHFRETGAFAPSSRGLARAMINALGTLQPGQAIIELGPGTGVFTRELVQRFPGHRVVAVEFNKAFAGRLRSTMPTVDVVEGCASQLRAHLASVGLRPEQIGGVISGLPLLSLPRPLGEAIVRSIGEVLPSGRRYVQFTYSRRAWRRFALPGFHAEPVKGVWLNLPPAVVMPFLRVVA